MGWIGVTILPRVQEMLIIESFQSIGILEILHSNILLFFVFYTLLKGNLNFSGFDKKVQ
tara:strand:- start:184 stop:360 length:177 start_codon:yes stop_codon:yes gene_type:complete